MNDKKSVYNVVKRETELGTLDDGERINAKPVTLTDAMNLAIETTNHYIRSEYRTVAPMPIHPKDARFRWEMQHALYRERKVIVDVVEVHS